MERQRYTNEENGVIMMRDDDCCTAVGSPHQLGEKMSLALMF